MEELNKFLDLMKHHLMFAVREEIQILKNTIGELVDRVNELEVENRILRCNSTPETLAAIVKNAATTRTASATATATATATLPPLPRPPPLPLPLPLQKSLTAANETNFDHVSPNTPNTTNTTINFK